MKQKRILTINHTDYLIPEEMTTKQISELIASIASLAIVNNTSRSIGKSWETVYFLDGVSVTYSAKDDREIMSNKAQATRQLDYLEQQAAQPETEDAF